MSEHGDAGDPDNRPTVDGVTKIPSSLAERSRARRERLVAHRATSYGDAEAWDLDFWQSRTPEERLSALVAIRREVELVEHARKERDVGDP